MSIMKVAQKVHSRLLDARTRYLKPYGDKFLELVRKVISDNDGAGYSGWSLDDNEIATCSLAYPTEYWDSVLIHHYFVKSVIPQAIKEATDAGFTAKSVSWHDINDDNVHGLIFTALSQ